MLEKFISEIESAKIQNNETQIRNVLGQVSTHLNNLASILEKGVRGGSPESIQKLKEFVIDVDSNELQKIYSLIDTIQSNNPAIINLVNLISQSKFTPQNIDMAREKIKNPMMSTGFPPKIDEEGHQQHVDNAIYNIKSEPEKTLKAVREMLQNAVDATDPKMHPHLLQRPGYKPRINITTNSHEGTDYVDLIVEDYGIGMDWNMLSKKFFVSHATGKSTDTGAAGGFGIAKSVIQNTPKHGWSIDTDGIHTSSFQRDVFWAMPMDSGYQPPKSTLKRNVSGGVTLSLFGLPYVTDGQIENLCKMYAISDRVKIFLNDREIKPLYNFDLNKMKVLGSEDFTLSDLYERKSEREIASKLEEKQKSIIEQSINQALDSVEGTAVSIKFAIQKNGLDKKTGSKSIVMVNEQFQFENWLWCPEHNVICLIETTARPGTQEYPIDPGRENLRGVLKDKVQKVLSTLGSFFNQIAENKLLEAGVDMVSVNQTSSPMSTLNQNVKFSNSRLADSIMSDLSQFIQQKKATGDLDETEIEDAIQRKFDESENAPPSSIQDEIIKNLVDLVKKDSPIKKSDIELTIEGLNAAATILIQKNIIGREWLDKNLDVTSEIMIIWQKTMRIVLDKLASSRTYRNLIRSREFIPGLIFSDECLGLFAPSNEDLGQKYPSVSINPLTVSSTVEPQKFAEKMLSGKAFIDERQSSYYEEDSSSPGADTPTNRLTKLLLHIATHELCHLLFPDYGSSSEEFHKNITFIEIIAHGCETDIKQVVKQYMPELRRKSKILINAFAKQKRNATNENRTISSFFEYLSGKSIRKTIVQNETTKDFFDFKVWLKETEN